MFMAESSADLQDVHIPASPGRFTCVKRDTSEPKCLAMGGNVPSPAHKQIQNVRFQMIVHFTTLLKFTGIRVDPHSLLRREIDCKTSLHLTCAITAGWLFWKKINA